MPVVDPGDLTAPMAVGVDPVRAVRLYTADLSEPPLVDEQTVLDLLTLNGQDERLAAAQALEMVATSEVLVARKIRTQDLQTDGPAVAAALRSQAAALRDAVAADKATVEGGDGFFGAVEFHPHPGRLTGEGAEWSWA